jgi:cytochrome oxidase Cu insertion factor (SCO1/SenC/PrrC family)
MRLLLVLALLSMAAPTFAHNSGEPLEKIMAAREPAFEAAGLRRIPNTEFLSEDGTRFSLEDMESQIVVLSFVPDSCDVPCSDQMALLAKAQEAIDVTPMREMVDFVIVASQDADIEDRRLSNWTIARPYREQSVAELEDTFGTLSVRGGNSPMIHVIDRGGRHAGIFHGADFNHVNMVLYINGLTNAHPPEPSLFDRIVGMFK